MLPNSSLPLPTVLLVFGGMVVFLLIYWTAVYNGLVAKGNSAKSAFSGIDVQLKNRWDLIPQLVEVTKGYAKHEHEIFIKLTEARAMAMRSVQNDHSRMTSEQVISEETPKILALAENYPDLKADEQFLLLQRNLTEIESQISASRRAYNASVLLYNNGLQMFPSSIIANKHQFKAMEFFSIDLAERDNVNI